MAYRELGVIEIREVLRRFCRGDGLRRSPGARGATARRWASTWPPRSRQAFAEGTPGRPTSAWPPSGRWRRGGPGKVPTRLTEQREQIATWRCRGAAADYDPPAPPGVKGRRRAPQFAAWLCPGASTACSSPCAPPRCVVVPILALIGATPHWMGTAPGGAAPAWVRAGNRAFRGQVAESTDHIDLVLGRAQVRAVAAPGAPGAAS